VTAWLQAHAVPVATVEPNSGYADLDVIAPLIGDAKLVSVGEATHGSSEFFKFKHRMLQFLVERLGFTAFIMEAGYVEGILIDSYVQGAPGNAADAAKATRFWTWSTPEVAAMLQWMHDYNADPSHARKIHFYGMDMQFSDSAGQYVLDYLSNVDAGAVAGAAAALAPFASLDSFDTYYLLPQAQRDADAAALAALIAQFDANSAAYIAATSEPAWAFAREAAVNVSQAQQFWSDQNEIHREQAMADNALWSLDREGASGRAMVWAHNGHVFSGPLPPLPWTTMGQVLRAALGNSMLVIGQEFDRGSFTALYQTPSKGKMYAVAPKLERFTEHFTVGSSSEGSLNDALRSAAIPLYLVDIRNASADPAAGAWWQQPHAERSIGAVYVPAHDKEWFYSIDVAPQGYDFVMYHDRVTAAPQLPWP
jgi:erythromycin esterase